MHMNVGLLDSDISNWCKFVQEYVEQVSAFS